MNLTIHPEAEREIIAAAAWYEEARPGLGDEFLDELDRALAQIKETPMLFPRVHKEKRRAQLKRFPYGVFFEVQSATVLVYTVYDLRRGLRGLRSRLRRS